MLPGSIKSQESVISYRRLVQSLLLLGLLSLCARTPALSQKGDWNRIGHARLDSAKAAKKGRTPLENKYAGLMPMIHTLSQEIRDNRGNITDIARKHALEGVDDSARILVEVFLSERAKLSDTMLVTNAVSKIGGRVVHTHVPKHSENVSMRCWIPYDKIETIAEIPTVANINQPGVMISR